MSNTLPVSPRASPVGVDPTPPSEASFTSTANQLPASAPCPYCRRLWNLILTGNVRCAPCATDVAQGAGSRLVQPRSTSGKTGPGFRYHRRVVTTKYQQKELVQ